MSNWENKIKWGMIVMLVILAGTYLYLLNSSVFTVADRRDNEEKIVDLEAKVFTLEADYLGRLSVVNLDFAKQLGFIEATGNIGFALKDKPLGLRLGADEI